MKTKRVLKVSKGDPTGESTSAGPSPLVSRITEAAVRLFLSRGFVRVTAGDIAAEVGISKATLYREFRSKEEILRAVVRGLMAEISGGVDSLLNDERLGFVERLTLLLAFIGGRMSQFGPLFVRDVQKGAPAIWKEIEDFRRRKLVANFRTILAAGHKQGLFRGDVDTDLLLNMFQKLIESFVNPAEILRSGKSPVETFESVIKVFFLGILTDRGRRDFSARIPAVFELRKEGAS